MGERKGVNKYYPPDWKPEMGGLNKYHGTHALRERARKLHKGILIIRFEMPYNIWCDKCNNHIGMGVRYNAEKSKVGMYYTTPIWKFRMKCHLCDNHYEMQTDPANLDYIILSGAKRQEKRFDPTQNGLVVPEDKAVIQRLASDAMFGLEHGTEDKKKSDDLKPALFELEMLQDRWRDDYMANKVLRNHFRKSKEEINNMKSLDISLLKKSSLNITLLPESNDDKKIAALMRLQPTITFDEKLKEKREKIEASSAFSSPVKTMNKEDLRNSIGIILKTGQHTLRPSETLSAKATSLVAYDSSGSDSS